MTLLEIFSKNLRKAMDRNPAADTGQKVEARCGISQQHISKLRRGMASPTLETLEQLAKAVGIQPFEFLVDDEAIRQAIYEKAIKGSTSEPDGKVVPLRRKRRG